MVPARRHADLADAGDQGCLAHYCPAHRVQHERVAGLQRGLAFGAERCGHADHAHDARNDQRRRIAPTARRYYATLDPAHNWDGVALNHPDIKNYHSANMWPGHTFTPLYFARFRVYDGAVPAAQIDPYYTGLK